MNKFSPAPSAKAQPDSSTNTAKSSQANALNAAANGDAPEAPKNKDWDFSEHRISVDPRSGEVRFVKRGKEAFASGDEEPPQVMHVRKIAVTLVNPNVNDARVKDSDIGRISSDSQLDAQSKQRLIQLQESGALHILNTTCD
jgi:hypothetical protein